MSCGRRPSGLPNGRNATTEDTEATEIRGLQVVFDADPPFLRVLRGHLLP
jgi:hypothetical protein